MLEAWRAAMVRAALAVGMDEDDAQHCAGNLLQAAFECADSAVRNHWLARYGYVPGEAETYSYAMLHAAEDACAALEHKRRDGAEEAAE